jgi:predicted GIY-YIG superfamily endonuclease
MDTSKDTEYEPKKFVSVYHLYFMVGDRKITYYIGRTGDVKRREREHRLAVKDTQEQTDKYRWSRQLEQSGIEWKMEVLSDMVEDNLESEYEWVLRAARNNRHDNIKFYNELPLTNLRRGDFLEEMLAEPTVNTAEQIRDWIAIRELRKQVEYEARQFVAPVNDAFGRVMNKLGGTSTVKGGARNWVIPKVEKRGKKR